MPAWCRHRLQPGCVCVGAVTATRWHEMGGLTSSGSSAASRPASMLTVAASLAAAAAQPAGFGAHTPCSSFARAAGASRLRLAGTRCGAGTQRPAQACPRGTQRRMLQAVVARRRPATGGADRGGGRNGRDRGAAACGRSCMMLARPDPQQLRRRCAARSAALFGCSRSSVTRGKHTHLAALVRAGLLCATTRWVKLSVLGAVKLCARLANRADIGTRCDLGVEEDMHRVGGWIGGWVEESGMSCDAAAVVPGMRMPSNCPHPLPMKLLPARRRTPWHAAACHPYTPCYSSGHRWEPRRRPLLGPARGACCSSTPRPAC